MLALLVGKFQGYTECKVNADLFELYRSVVTKRGLSTTGNLPIF